MQRKISIKGLNQLSLLGTQDSHLRLMEGAFGARVALRGDEIVLTGEEQAVDASEKLLTELIFLLNRNSRLNENDVAQCVGLVRGNAGSVSQDLDPASPIVLYGKKGLIKPKTPGQEAYFKAVGRNDVVFAIGPAGTGKTYLAVAMALAQLREQEVSKIILSRPAIEAGESLGFLPGDLMDKVDPYLRPLTDAIFTMLPSEQLQKYVERKIIEIVPLAYMRGRTLNDAFVILDEAQNTTTTQMKMFLTRLGVNSKAVVTGDVTQIDLPLTAKSGLVQIRQILDGIEGIAFVDLEQRDVVRHRLVKEIIQAYEVFHTTPDHENEA